MEFNQFSQMYSLREYHPSLSRRELFELFPADIREEYGSYWYVDYPKAVAHLKANSIPYKFDSPND